MSNINIKNNFILPNEIVKMINDYCKPITKPDWRLGNPTALLIQKESVRVGFCYFSWTHMTLSSFLITHDLMRKSTFNLDNEEDYRLWKSIILYTQNEFTQNGFYL